MGQTFDAHINIRITSTTHSHLVEISRHYHLPLSNLIRAIMTAASLNIENILPDIKTCIDNEKRGRSRLFEESGGRCLEGGERYREDRRERVRTLHNEGVGEMEIARILGISVRAVMRILTDV